MYKILVTINQNPNGEKISEKTFVYRCYDYDFLDGNEIGLDCEDLCYRIYKRKQLVTLTICDIK